MHNLVIGLASNGLTMALGDCVFIVSLNMDIYNPKMLALKAFQISNTKGFTFFD
jgi:hypothetical protein